MLSDTLLNVYGASKKDLRTGYLSECQFISGTFSELHPSRIFLLEQITENPRLVPWTVADVHQVPVVNEYSSTCMAYSWRGNGGIQKGLTCPKLPSRAAAKDSARPP